MKAIVTFLVAMTISFNTHGQQTRAYDLNGHRFEVTTTYVDGCYGQERIDKLYEVTNDTRYNIGFAACCGSSVIFEISHDPQGQVEKLVVSHTMGESIFYLIEGAWVRKT